MTTHDYCHYYYCCCYYHYYYRNYYYFTIFSLVLFHPCCVRSQWFLSVSCCCVRGGAGALRDWGAPGGGKRKTLPFGQHAGSPPGRVGASGCCFGSTCWSLTPNMLLLFCFFLSIFVLNHWTCWWRGHRVLLFSQMTRMLDILQDYMEYRGEKSYCIITYFDAQMVLFCQHVWFLRHKQNLQVLQSSQFLILILVKDFSEATVMAYMFYCKRLLACGFFL